MEYIEKSDNVEKVYSVYYDKEKLNELLDKIVRNTSYKTNGLFTAPYDSTYEGKAFVSGAELPNGDPMFENIEEIYYCTSEGQYSYHGDSVCVQGTKVTPPKLASIIQRILSNNPDSIYDFLNYETSDELVPIDEKIEAAYKDVVNIDNFDFDEKIKILNRVEKLLKVKRRKEYFNAELLKQYYMQACSLLELELISETVTTIKKNSGRVLLKDYKKL